MQNPMKTNHFGLFTIFFNISHIQSIQLLLESTSIAYIGPHPIMLNCCNTPVVCFPDSDSSTLQICPALSCQNDLPKM